MRQCFSRFCIAKICTFCIISSAILTSNVAAVSKIGPGPQTASPAVDYLIITNDLLKNSGSFQPLINSKALRGLFCQIQTVEIINAMVTGRDLQEKIRNYIKDMSARHGLSWVLLGGDNTIVPARRVTVIGTGDLLTDMYYSNLDGDWDLNENGQFGEFSDKIDPYPDVFVGRVPAKNADEVQIFVQKVLIYETNNANYRNKILLLGTTDWNDVGGRVNDLIDQEYLNSTYQKSKYYQRIFPSYRSQAIQAMNEGYHLINHIDHGTSTSLSTGEDYLSISDIDALQNQAAPSILYAADCNAAVFDQESIAQHWIMNPHGGGVAFIGNTGYGWNPESDEYLNVAFYESLFRKGYRHLGQAFVDSKLSWMRNFNQIEGRLRFVMFGLTLLGDPEMTVQLEDQNQLYISTPKHGSYIQSWLDIYGSAYLPQGFRSYEVYAKRADNLGTSFTVHSSFNPVQNDRLAVWNTRGISDGEYNLMLKMTNDQGDTIETKSGVNVIVDNKNNPPEFVNVSNKGAIVGKTMKFQIRARDLDNPETPQGQLTYSVIHPFGEDAHFDPLTQMFSWKPVAMNQSGYDIELVASDDKHSALAHVALRTLQMSETQITNDGIWRSNVSIDHSHVVWQAYVNGKNSIFLYDLLTETTKIITDTGYPQYPSIYGNKIVWIAGDATNKDVYVYDLSSFNPQPEALCLYLSEKAYTSIYEDKIVYTDKRNGQWDVYMYDLNLQQEIPIAINSAPKAAPNIYKNRIVWGDARAGNYDIYMYDLSLRKEFSICTHKFDQIGPVIYDHFIAWEDRRDGNRNIFIYDLASATEIPADPGPYFQMKPALYGNRVIWEDLRNGNVDVYMYDMLAREVTQLTDSSASDLTPKIYDNKIFWNRYSSEEGANVFTGTFLYPSQPPILTMPFTNKTISEGEWLRFEVSAKGANNGHLVFTHPLNSELPRGAAFYVTKNEKGIIKGIFSWVPNFIQAGTYSMIFEVSDGIEKSSEVMTIQVEDVNRPPVIVRVMNFMNLWLYWWGKDSEDGANLRYSYRVDNSAWTKLVKYAAVHIKDLKKKYNLRRGSHTFQVKAIDSKGAESSSVSRTFSVL